MLGDIKKFMRDPTRFSIASDRWLQYKDWVMDEMPTANYQDHSGQDLKRRVRAMASVDTEVEVYDYGDEPLNDPVWMKQSKNGIVTVKAYDPLFHVNQTCMKLRSSISRMRRDFWGYSQKVENLQYHLWIYQALNNGYKLRY